MASQSRIHTSRALQTAAKLRPFVLSNVTPTGKMLGEGSYGCVEELNMNGLVCAGKKIYEILIEPENEGADRMVEKYYDECQLLSSLRHPNIVQFLGICFLETQSISTTDLKLPVLIMEMLQGSLDHLLENTPNIPLAKKCSILQDVARGLVYLHNRSPAVIHRDLTARNVLLNSAMVAKISDMGNSRIVNIRPSQLAKTMTRGVPGTIVYMPPEAFDIPPKYGPKLDTFSFGHLALFTATQEFPGDILPSTYQDKRTGRLIPRNEVERRGRYMETLRATLGTSHGLVQLITRCLDYNPARRPTASETMKSLEQISSQVHDAYHNMTRLDLEKKIQELETKLLNQEPVLLRGLEAMESELLQTLKAMKGVVGKKPHPITAEHIVEFSGIRYNMVNGSVSGNPIEEMILVSVGSEFPADLVVQPRIKNPALAKKAIQTYGCLPPIVPGLHEEAAADLMAIASVDLKGSNQVVVHLCLDVPTMQRSKHYYLKRIEEFMENCQQPVALIGYNGHSEEGTGDWCFKDGTISFQEIFSLSRKHCRGKLLTIRSDCCYSGHWLRECAKALDSLGIPPCGHRARENGALLRVFASCRPDEKAAEPWFTMEALTVKNNVVLAGQLKQPTQQTVVRFDSASLVCCKSPDSACPKNTFKHLKWEDAIDGALPIRQIKRNERGRDKWYYIMLHRAGKAYKDEFNSQFKKDSALKLSDWGYVLASGEGKIIPNDIEDKINRWTLVSHM